MNKRSLLSIFLIVISFSSLSQNNVLTFDGIDDYVDLGKSAGNNVRTIELWFKLDTKIDSTLPGFKPLVMRQNTSSNIDEFSLFFRHSNETFSGHLMFDITESVGKEKRIVSNSNSWVANKWYHVAAVVHPSIGMMLFIDGVKQLDTDTYSSSTNSNTAITAIGCWGNRTDLDRFFKGKIDDIRFSNQALYTTDFTPPCPDQPLLTSTIGLWNLNEGIGTIANDSSANAYHGQIHGAIWTLDTICENISTANTEKLNFNDIKIYPNPSNNIFNIELSQFYPDLNLTVINTSGQIIYQKEKIKRLEKINLANNTAGIYFYIITDNKTFHQSGKLIKY